MIVRVGIALVYNSTIFPIAWVLSRLKQRRTFAEPRTLALALDGPPHLGPSGPWWRPSEGPPWPPFLALMRAAAEEKNVKGLFLVLDGASGSLSEFEALRTEIQRFKQSGKSVHLHLEGLDNRTAPLALQADDVTLSPGGSVMLRGLSAETRFYGELLSKLGVQVDVARRGAFKGFVEPYSRAAPTEAFEQALSEMLGSVTQFWHQSLAAGSRPSTGLLAELEERPVFGRDGAQKLGLVHALKYADEAESALAQGEMPPPVFKRAVSKATGKTLDPELLALPAAPLIRPRLRPFRRPRGVAVVSLSGTIVDDAPGPGSRNTIVGREWANRLDELRTSPAIAGVIVAIDSRGGSASASDRIWHALRRLSEVKPTVAWMRDYAASGGYYIAAGARYIVASPFTLTGSIGVAWLKPSAGAAARRAGVRTFTYGQMAGRSATSTTDALSPADRETLEQSLDEAYQRFLHVVAEARNLTPEQAHERAQGRVWTGAQAHERGLVDELGSYPEAEAWIRAACELPASGPLPLAWVGQRPLWQRALHMLDRFAVAPALPPFARQTWSDMEEFALLSRIGGVVAHAPALDVR